MPADFAAWYAALGLAPGAPDDEIRRAKRAYNELYHADRLAHMSETARAIAEEKVKAANEAAQALLDPRRRAERDRWAASVAPGAGGPPPPPGPTPPEADAPPPSPWHARTAPAARRTLPIPLVGLGAGLTLGVVAFALLGRRAPPTPQAPPRDTVASAPVPALARDSTPAPRPAPSPAVRSVTDSVVALAADGRWTPSIRVGGREWRVSVIPEGQVNYRVRRDGGPTEARFGAPTRLAGDATRALEFASMTGEPARLRFSRWRAGAPRRTLVHTLRVTAPGGEWGGRVWFGDLDVHWEPDRRAAYQARDDQGRVINIPEGVRALSLPRTPEWLEFRSTDGQPISLLVRYSSP